MVVIADTSPLNYLLLIGEIDLLRDLYEEVVVPGAVLVEMTHFNAPVVVRSWAQNLPLWVSVVRVVRSTSDFPQLGSGEAEALIIAIDRKADAVLLVDDLEARRVAAEAGVTFTGTLGILDAAADAGLRDFDSTIAKLRDTNFHVADGVIAQIRQRRKQRS
jgi:predicted nucleic acid-binding protein